MNQINSTLFVLEMFDNVTSFLTERFRSIERGACRGIDPRKNSDWPELLKELKENHSKDICGILIVSWESIDVIDDNAFVFILVPKKWGLSQENITIGRFYSYLKGRKIVDFIEF